MMKFPFFRLCEVYIATCCLENVFDVCYFFCFQAAWLSLFLFLRLASEAAR